MAVYFVPFLVPHDSSTHTLARYSEPVERNGTGAFREALDYTANVPAMDDNNPDWVTLGFRFRITNTGEQHGQTLRIEVAIQSQLHSGLLYRLHFSQGHNGWFEQTAPTNRTLVRCPCSADEIRWTVSLDLENPDAGPYAYRFEPIQTVSVIEPADSDSDGIADRNQWVSGVPQYVVSLGLGFPGLTLFFWRPAWRRKL